MNKSLTTLMIIVAAGLNLVTAQVALALGEVSYSGNIVNIPTAASSGSTEDPTNVAANIILKYSIPKVIAISVFDDEGNHTNNPLLDGEFASPPTSKFNVEINPTEIGTNAINNLYFEIHSVAFTNVGNISVLLSSPSAVDSNTIQLSNGTNTINVDISSSTVVDSVVNPTVFPLNTAITSPVSETTGRGNFQVVGRFDQSTLTPLMQPGNYSGSITLTLAAP